MEIPQEERKGSLAFGAVDYRVPSAAVNLDLWFVLELHHSSVPLCKTHWFEPLLLLLSKYWLGGPPFNTFVML